jgi:hypothetical protein
MPSYNLLWIIELMIVDELMAVRSKVDISMAVESPNVFAAYFG